jgi:predicted PurR-regulated permease PerM
MTRAVARDAAPRRAVSDRAASDGGGHDQAHASQFWFWLALGAGAIFLAWLLNGVLLPFVAGLAVAFFLEPVSRRLERLGLGRGLAAFAVVALFVAVGAGLAALLVPPFSRQIQHLIEAMPQMLEKLGGLIHEISVRATRFAVPGAREVPSVLPATTNERLQALTPLLQQAVSGLLGGGLVLIELVFVLVLTPVIAFYFLRDWDVIVLTVESLLPRRHVPTLRVQATEIRLVLSRFVRGQTAVCLVLAAWYAGTMTLAGIDFALVIGIATGVLSFIPYLGTMLGFMASIAAVLVQAGPDAAQLGAVVAVFVLAQVLEAAFLQPQLIGPRVGLHPLWLIFGLLAGGALFGVLGVLLAVPIFASLGVVARFAVRCYLEEREDVAGLMPPPAVDPSFEALAKKDPIR